MKKSLLEASDYFKVFTPVILGLIFSALFALLLTSLTSCAGIKLDHPQVGACVARETMELARCFK